MNRHLKLILQLDELVLLRDSLLCAGLATDELGKDSLAGKIEKLRRQLPGHLLSQYDQIARLHANAVATVADNLCQGCRLRISPKLAHLMEASDQMTRCPHCGRFLVTRQAAPDYVGFS
jgi:predicted  nucleic acid-binding Zn-ribbon protein